jgi:hypothetical protein
MRTSNYDLPGAQHFTHRDNNDPLLIELAVEEALHLVQFAKRRSRPNQTNTSLDLCVIFFICFLERSESRR